MRNIFTFIFVLFLSCNLASFSQNIAITDNDLYSADSKAMLDVNSATKGMLIPRVTTIARLAIATPPTSLLVFDTSLNQFMYYNGATWVNLVTSETDTLWSAGLGNIYLSNTLLNLGVGSTDPKGKLEVKADILNGLNEPIFDVVNSNGDTIFAVYPNGVRINVYDDTLTRASSTKGGFAVGGFSPSRGASDKEYLRVTPDSVRIYIEEGNLNRASSTKGGFAVGGFSPSRGFVPTDYFNVYGSNDATIIDPSESRILWYPLKEALLSGRVLVESPDSVGTNSMATGFESKAIGNYSQAFGYQTRAFGLNSTAIGYLANAIGDNSYALGNQSLASDTASYAIGTEAHATGLRSFAIGSRGIDVYGFPIGSTTASGDYSYAFGMGSIASAQGAFSIGTKTTASGTYSTAIGNKSTASNQNTIAIGYNAVASGSSSIAIGADAVASGCTSTEYCAFSSGNWCRAEGSGSVAMGSNTVASGHNGSISLGYLTTASGGSSVAMGSTTTASGMNSTAIGGYTVASGYGSTALGSDIIVQGSRSFGIGLNNPFPSSWTITQDNTMSIMGGNVGIGTVSPDKLLHVAGDARVEGDIYYGVGINTYSKPDFVFNPNYTKKFTISEVEEFIVKNNHLPWVTSAKNEKDGVNLTRMSFETLESVENIQMQIIELKNANEDLKNIIVDQNNLLRQMKKEIDDLQKSKKE